MLEQNKRVDCVWEEIWENMKCTKPAWQMTLAKDLSAAVIKKV